MLQIGQNKTTFVIQAPSSFSIFHSPPTLTKPPDGRLLRTTAASPPPWRRCSVAAARPWPWTSGARSQRRREQNERPGGRCLDCLELGGFLGVWLESQMKLANNYRLRLRNNYRLIAKWEWIKKKTLTGSTVVLENIFLTLPTRFSCFWPFKSPKKTGPVVRSLKTTHRRSFRTRPTVRCWNLQRMRSCGNSPCFWCGRCTRKARWLGLLKGAPHGCSLCFVPSYLSKKKLLLHFLVSQKCQGTESSFSLLPVWTGVVPTVVGGSICLFLVF